MTDIELLIVGDIYVRRPDPEGAFARVADRFARADLRLGNLEGVVADGVSPIDKGGLNVWKAEAGNLAALPVAGFDALAFANNHAMDYGAAGVAATLAGLDRLGIAHCGAGKDLVEAHTPAVVEAGGQRVAMLGYTSVFAPGWEAGPQRPGLAVLRARTAYEPDQRVLELPGAPPIVRSWMRAEDLEVLRRDIDAARARAEIVVCSFHWGISGGYEKLTEYQVELGHRAIDFGADLVVGHHPHLLQGIEIYRGCAIYYSLGNFTFARHTPGKGQELESLVARLTIRDGTVAELGVLPACCDHALSPGISAGDERARVLALLQRRSADFGTRFVDDRDGWSVAAPPA